jgi:hypothetical protein
LLPVKRTVRLELARESGSAAAAAARCCNFCSGLADFGAVKIFPGSQGRLNVAGSRPVCADAGAFSEIAIRRGYYPAHGSREDAVVMQLELT